MICHTASGTFHRSISNIVPSHEQHLMIDQTLVWPMLNCHSMNTKINNCEVMSTIHYYEIMYDVSNDSNSKDKKKKK